MAESLTFPMGKFAAVLPADLRYCRNHMWCRPGDDGGRPGGAGPAPSGSPRAS